MNSLFISYITFLLPHFPFKTEKKKKILSFLLKKKAQVPQAVNMT